MKLPTPPPEDLEQLIAVCLELYEESGARAVDSLLAEHSESAELVRQRLDLLNRMGLVGEAPEQDIPERIGDYQILGVLGRGGMGIVYEAQQTKPKRRVALKLLRTLPGTAARSRFRHEADLLARLSHPGIAQVFEVGTETIGGMTVPFFAMELVRGEQIDVFANQSELDVRERLELVAKIGDAVQHAHQKGIIHRDLKPANILVDERGQPRILDFGVARVIDPDLKRETLRTEIGQLVGTLAYMSPEQAAGDSVGIDSRTDVYSLGVIAYELLTGRLPHPVKGRSVLEALHSISEVEAPLLSAHDPSLRGDVERIVAKALDKDKEQRYASAHELAADMRRHLNHEPIAARPATAAYQLAKFTRRHRALVGGAVAFVLALALGLAGTLNGMVNTANQRDDAERRFKQANAVIAFQKHMFALADPLQKGIRVEDLLDRALLQVQGATEDPVEQASLLLMLGEAYGGLGLYDDATPLITQTATIFGRELGPRDLQTLSAKTRLAALYGHPLGRLDKAETALEGVIETATRVHGQAHDVTLDARLVRATLEFERGDNDESGRIAREVLALITQDQPQWIPAKNRLAKSLRAEGQVDEAISIAREVHTWSLSKFGEQHPQTWSAMDTLGNVLVQEGRLIEGQALLEELLALRTKHLGRHHADTINTMMNVAVGYSASRDDAQAEKLLLEVIDVLEARYAPTHPERLAALHALGNAYSAQNRAAEAEQIFREVVGYSIDVHGPEHSRTLSSMACLALCLERLGRFEEAEELFLETLEIMRQGSEVDNSYTVILIYNLASLYAELRQFEQADPYFQEAIEKGRDVIGPDHFVVGTFLRGYGTNCINLRRYGEAEEALLEAREWGQRTLPDFARHPSYITILERLKTLYQMWGKPEESEVFAALLRERR